MNDNSIKGDFRQSKMVLSDKQTDGKERPWKEKKISNTLYYEILSILGLHKAERVSACAEVLEFNVADDQTKKLKKAWFCKSPLCPICNWRKAMKQSYQITRVVSEVVRQRKTARWLFLTLTVRNVYDGEELDKSLKAMAEGFRRLMMYKKISKNLIGFVRSTEITVNPENGSYNQHIHVLLCVKSTYFKDDANYITQSEWTTLWQKAMKLDYTPIVHIQVVKDVRKKEIASQLPTGLESTIKETGKYAVKDADYLTGKLEEDMTVVADLEQGLYKKRMIGWGGLLKEVHKELNLDDENGDLLHVNEGEEESHEEVAFVLVARWNWAKQNYFVD